MKVALTLGSKNYTADLNHPIDISIPLRAGKENLTAWYIDSPRIEPVVSGDWIGDVAQGGTVNFRNIYFNPHGHGTHTECVGHISKEWFSVNKELRKFFATAKVITVNPEKQDDKYCITKTQIENAVNGEHTEAIIIRTLPNSEDKKVRQYSNTNPPYLHPEAALWMREKQVIHILIDLPSVDPEKDEGRLSAHKTFWNYPEAPRLNATITEFIYVNDSVSDGLYLLNLMIAPFENDASPSKPVLYKLNEN